VKAGKDGSTGRFDWRHDGAGSDELLITSPLGQGVARISRQDGKVRLVTADSKEYVAPDAEGLTEQVLGWRLPLSGLPDWIRGRPTPGSPAQLRRDDTGRVVELTQDDWRVDYQEFEGALPSRVRLARGDLEIRLVIERWTHPQGKL
jgi:outer membrane lipoprotein LolB